MDHDKNCSSGTVGTVQSVLFVCTGNIFRSVTAEYALKFRLGANTSCIVGSAGIDFKPQPVHDWVRTNLSEKGADLRHHTPRQLTKELVEAPDLVVAMGRDHQNFIREQFGRDVPLFNQICLGHDTPIFDLHEVIPDWEADPERARAYVCSVIDVIWATAPAILSRLR
jgi:protein-tyrosine phosphatase